MKASRFTLAACLGGLLISFPSDAQTRLPCLTTVQAVRNVSPEQAAESYPVKLRGVVTFCDADYDRGFFLQDATAGIYIKLSALTNYDSGDELEIEGVTAPGDFVPLVMARKITFLRHHAAMPAPLKSTYDELATGNEDSQWVELSGVVRSVVPTINGHQRVDMLINGRRLSATVLRIGPDADKWIAASVRVRGVCRTRFNNKRQMYALFLSVTSGADFVIDKLAGPPAELRLTQLLRFNSEGYYGRRVRVQGVVTAQRGLTLFIQDGGEGLPVKMAAGDNTLSPGTWVEVTGFPGVGQSSLQLEDGVAKALGRRAMPPPVDARMQQLVSQDYDGELVRVRGLLINHAQRPGEWVLVVQADNLIMNARLDDAAATRWYRDLPQGSELELTGVCVSQPMENWNPSVATPPESFQLLLRSAQDVKVVRNPPFWTLGRLLLAIGMLSLILLVGFGWVMVLDRRVRQQTAIIQQKAQREAVLEERTRIAREFHDTLEQELVAITIQLETVAAQFDTAPAIARQMLDLARNMSRRSLVEAKRSVWDLRSHLLENSSLLSAITEVTKLMSSSTRIRIAVETSGEPRKLAPQVENNLLRIVQEALSNALKHSKAEEIRVHLDYEPKRVILRITDDGVGFETSDRSVIYGGHFGLLDMSERAGKMGGNFTMISAPGQGTEIRVEVIEKGEAAAALAEALPV